MEVSDNESVERIVIDVCARKFLLYSDLGTTRHVDCETTEQFMDVLDVVQSTADPELIEYASLTTTENEV
tara:strand:- start:5072 stop:5281 length:210 start_codon:yes stop_codon:yes gene_type:complete